MHEAQLHADNCFITLTYDEDHVPPGGTLVLDDFQRFMKRLRKRFGSKIRFFHCGEYGETTARPHYHALLFNFDFPDKELFKRNARGDALYTSAALQELWPYGLSSIGDVTFDSAAYVARYVVKKVTGPAADNHYQGRKPEYTTMSRSKGIGYEWWQRYKIDIINGDHVVHSNKSFAVPKYYDKLYELEDKEAFEELKHQRTAKARKFKDDQTPERLAVKREVKESQISMLKRQL